MKKHYYLMTTMLVLGAAQQVSAQDVVNRNDSIRLSAIADTVAIMKEQTADYRATTRELNKDAANLEAQAAALKAQTKAQYKLDKAAKKG